MTFNKAPGRLVLLDRDGTLVREADYPKDPRKVRLLPGVPRALRKLKAAGLKVVVVTNQSGVGRGFITLPEMHSVNKRFLELLAIKKAPIDGLYWCPHHPNEKCSCRKPALGMVRQASHDLKTSWKKSISVGDRASDVLLGQKTGGRGILVLTGYGQKQRKAMGSLKPDHIARTFVQAAEWILRNRKR